MEVVYYKYIYMNWHYYTGSITVLLLYLSPLCVLLCVSAMDVVNVVFHVIIITVVTGVI